MKKRKKGISGVGSDSMTTAAVIVASVPLGLAAAHFGKQQLIPALTKDTDTAEQKKTTAMYANAGVGLAGVLLIVGGAYVMEKEPELGLGMMGLGAGAATQAGYAAYVNRAGATTNQIAGPWDVSAWNNSKQEAMRNFQMSGADNASAGLMGAKKHRVNGADNASPGLMGTGKIKQPFLTNMDNNIGKLRGHYNKVGSCGM